MPAPTVCNRASQLLEPDENNLVYSLLGPKCTTLATTVAQLYYGEGVRWNLQTTGVLCFVRDAAARSFFLRFYDLDQRQLIFQQEIYRGMAYNSQYAFFHQVEADKCVVGFNFVDDSVGQDEAHELAGALKAKVEKMANSAAARQEMVQPPVLVGGGGPMGQPAGSAQQAAPKRAGGGRRSAKGGSQQQQQQQRGKIRREDIGAPTNFIHVQHVGYDNLEGGDLLSALKDAMKGVVAATQGADSDSDSDSEDDEEWDD